MTRPRGLFGTAIVLYFVIALEVLTPFLPAPIYTWDRDAQGVEGVKEVLGSGFYIYAMNFLGLPAGNIPAKYNDALPVSVQIVGRRFREGEDMILDACEAVEKRVGVMAEKLFEKETGNGSSRIEI